MAAKKKNKDLSVYILLDRSGSMSGSKWEHAIGSINSYTHQLKKEGTVDAKITVASFDSSSSALHNSFMNSLNQVSYKGSLYAAGPTLSFVVHREEANLDSYKDIDFNEISPRGMTPLYDATARLINMADQKNSDKTVIIIMTDGEENSSAHYNLVSIKDRINTCMTRGWEVIFMGAEFNADRTASSYGLPNTKVVNSPVRNFTATMNAFATSSAAYATTGLQFNTSELRTNEID